MKIFTVIFTLVASTIVIYNLTLVDFQNPFGKHSTVAWITILAALCGIILLQILRLSKQVDRKLKENS